MNMTDQQREELATRIVDSLFEVHNELGPGLLETAYEAALCREFAIRKIRFQKQRAVPVEYKGVMLECGFRIDVFVEDEIILELKSVDGLLPIHEAQVINYLPHGQTARLPRQLQRPTHQARHQTHGQRPEVRTVPHSLRQAPFL